VNQSAIALESAATRDHLDNLGDAERVAWRLADIPDRPSADERNLPHDFPFGWFIAAYSDAVSAGEVLPMRYFGKELVLWRGDDGRARVLDAYCAHYGAHMAHGGRVHGNLLECPFHAWRWDQDGIAREIPYSRVIPPQAKRKDCVPSWPTCEVNGFIWIWYHPDRVPPLWDVQPVEEVACDDWTPPTRFEWNIYSSLENMADNNVDISHFKYVHGAPTVPTYEISFEGRRRTVLTRIALTTPRGPVDGSIDSFTYGPGQGWVRFRGLCDTLLQTVLTPVDRDHLKVSFAFTQPAQQATGSKARLAKALIDDICRQMDQDKVILDRYQRRDRPLVCEGDGPFGKNRQYYSQFFAGRKPPLIAA
jgi:3-ketosteroid 9alpha-monooxygenase subunit A